MVYLEGPYKQGQGKKHGFGGGAQPHSLTHVVTVTHRHTHCLPLFPWGHSSPLGALTSICLEIIGKY